MGLWVCVLNGTVGSGIGGVQRADNFNIELVCTLQQPLLDTTLYLYGIP